MYPSACKLPPINTVALNDFLLTGGETNLGFLTRASPQVHDMVELRDIRRVVIEALARTYPAGK